MPSPSPAREELRAEVVILGATPAGIMAAIAASRRGRTTLLLERGTHLGGLPANGLGATDIGTRGATGGLFLEFVRRVRAAYVASDGEGSDAVRLCSDGYHFEPSVAERVLEAMLADIPRGRLVVRTRVQFDALPAHVEKRGTRPVALRLTDLATSQPLRVAGDVFIDATYEGDLAAAAGADFRLGREPASLHGEPFAGVVYKGWDLPADPVLSTGAGDGRIQAYNYRLCLTRDPANRLPFAKPADYDRAEYASLVDDLLHGRRTGPVSREFEPDGIGFLTNIVLVPHGKTDANNQHLAFLSTDLPEENQLWPTADWAWRDRFAARLRSYTEGLFWFASSDTALPEAFRRQVAAWGWAADEYRDNGGFPRQVYVREGRRIVGLHDFTAHDALPGPGSQRPPVHRDSITASHYSLDSHAVRKREPGKPHLEGFFNSRTVPYTVPYGVIVPQGVEGLLVPVAVSGTHVGFSTLRMEPCWMALGEAAGEAAALALETRRSLASIDTARLQDRLLDAGAVLIHIPGIDPASEQGRTAQLRLLGR